MPNAFKIPDKQPGDNLGAGHINELNRAARIVLAGKTGSFSSGNKDFQANPPPFFQQAVEITSIDDAPFYKCRPLYFDHDAYDAALEADSVTVISNYWERDDDANEYDLDASAVDSAFGNGTKLNAYWHPQRQAYIPTAASALFYCRPPQSISGGAEGKVYILTGPRNALEVATLTNDDGEERQDARWGINNDSKEIPASTLCWAIPFVTAGVQNYNSTDDDNNAVVIAYEIVPLACT